MVVVAVAPGDGGRGVGRAGRQPCWRGDITSVAPAFAIRVVARAIPALVVVSHLTAMPASSAVAVVSALVFFARGGAIRIATQTIAVVILAVAVQIRARFLISEVAFVVTIIYCNKLSWPC